jgi:hypothetical protein
MHRQIGATAMLSLALAMPVHEAGAQDPLAGAILGGAAGAILGGALGGGRGAAAGAIIGGSTGAIIGAQGQPRAGGYYYYNGGCYIQTGDGAWMAAAPRYCGGPTEVYAAPPPPPGDAVAYCMQRYRSYDPATQTFMGFDGVRRSCP